MKKYIMISEWILIGLFIGTIAGYYFVKGIEYYDKQDYRHAAEMLNRSIGSDPKNPDLAMLLLPGTYRNLGFNDLAKEAEKYYEPGDQNKSD